MAQELRGGEKVSGVGLRGEFMKGAIANQISKQQKKWNRGGRGTKSNFWTKSKQYGFIGSYGVQKEILKDWQDGMG